jgi:hypothetical protein
MSPLCLPTNSTTRVALRLWRQNPWQALQTQPPA